MNKATVLLLAILMCSFSVGAEIYKWVDTSGKVHFTDTPPVNKKTEKVEVKVNSYTAVEITPLLQRLSKKDKVVLYTTDWCVNCKKAKAHFQKKGIAYVAYDVEKSWTGKNDYKLLRGRAVPIIIVGDKRMNGFTASRFDKLYQDYEKRKKETREQNEKDNNS